MLGREVYSSNEQLGGIQIMHNNGVTHLTVRSDFEGIVSIVDWLGYVSKVREGGREREEGGREEGERKKEMRENE